MIEDYLNNLKMELTKLGAEPAVVQDALYDAQEYFSGEATEGLADDALKQLIESYGAPVEVARSYVEAELSVAQAMRLPEPVRHRSMIGRFFGVLVDARTYSALFYMFLAFGTGIAYFTLAVMGISLSIGFSILIFGIPFMLVFLSLIRGVSFVEGRLVEALLGVRMPRRPRLAASESSLFGRIKWWLTDRRTWTTLAYMLFQLPLGVVYFTGLVTGFAVSFALMAASALQLLTDIPIATSGNYVYVLEPWVMPVAAILGAILLVILMHIVRGVGTLHGAYAKAMLVGNIEDGGAK